MGARRHLVPDGLELVPYDGVEGLGEARLDGDTQQ